MLIPHQNHGFVWTCHILHWGTTARSAKTFDRIHRCSPRNGDVAGHGGMVHHLSRWQTCTSCIIQYQLGKAFLWKVSGKIMSVNIIIITCHIVYVYTHRINMRPVVGMKTTNICRRQQDGQYLATKAFEYYGCFMLPPSKLRHLGIQRDVKGILMGQKRYIRIYEQKTNTGYIQFGVEQFSPDDFMAQSDRHPCGSRH